MRTLAYTLIASGFSVSSALAATVRVAISTSLSGSSKSLMVPCRMARVDCSASSAMILLETTPTTTSPTTKTKATTSMILRLSFLEKDLFFIILL